ncbi:MAG: carotenoid biosynthesis protein [Chloroflexota bacterium]
MRIFPINPYSVIFEIMIYVLFAICVWHASCEGRFVLVELLWTGAYGFALEWLTLKQLQAYHYGQFLIAMDGAPLAVALGWAVVIYASMRFSDRLPLPDSVRPILDALLALNVDLGLDVIAIRIGLWEWNGVALDQQWFGVPYANFWAWFVVTWAYSGFIRALRSWQHYRILRWLYAPFAIVLSLIMVITGSELYRLMASNGGAGSGNAVASLFLIVGSLTIVLNALLTAPRTLHDKVLAPIISIVPLVIHIFAVTVGIIAGIFAKQPILALICVAMLLINLGVHGLFWSIGRARLQRLKA